MINRIRSFFNKKQARRLIMEMRYHRILNRVAEFDLPKEKEGPRWE